MKYWLRINNVQVLKIVVAAGFVLSLLLPSLGLASVACKANGEAELSLIEDKYIETLKTPYQLEQPFAGKTKINNIGEYIQTIYKFGLGIVGIVAVVLIMAGGLRWVAAAGNESAIEESKKMIISAVTGLVIALLSYVILLTISPQLVSLDAEVYKIPIPTACSFPPPVTQTIPQITGVTGSGQICPGAVNELNKIAEHMRLGPDKVANTGDELCSTCSIGISSTLRTYATQQRLYDCYQKALTELKVNDGSKCTSGCDSCNKATQPCCSNHEQGKALDVWLEGVPPDKGLASSNGYLKASNNNGGKGGKMVAKDYDCTKAINPELCKNQYLLRSIMTYTGSKFVGISDEWWHFDFKGDCMNSQTCIVGQGQDIPGVGQTAAEAYCAASTKDGPVYSYALCQDGKVVCTNNGGYSFSFLNGGCSATPPDIAYYDFSGKKEKSKFIYLELPGCTKVRINTKAQP